MTEDMWWDDPRRAKFPLLDPKKVRSSFESKIGQRYLELVTACLTWARESRMHLLTEETLPSAVKLESFQTICEIHEELKAQLMADCVPGFILEMVRGGYGLSFVIVFVYITKSVPLASQCNVCLHYLGFSSNLLGVFKKLQLLPASDEENVPQAK